MEFTQTEVEKMQAIRALLVGFPTEQLFGDPLDTLYGIRVRDWALFTLLPKYGFETSYLIEPKAKVSDALVERYGERLVRGAAKAEKMISDNQFDVIICSATKYHEFWRHRSALFAKGDTPIFGAFCYDNDPAPLESSFCDRFIGASFTSHDHKTIWDDRGAGVPSITTTTGQNAPSRPVVETDGSVAFVGYIHDERYLAKMANMAVALPDREFIVVSSFVRDHNMPGKQYHQMEKLTETERQALVSEVVSKHTDAKPSNFRYAFLPPGEDDGIMQRCAVGLDFSWLATQTIENSKICRYLTHGIFPISQLPATSFRFVERFNYGAIVPFSASPDQWTEAIKKADQVSSKENRERIAREAEHFFSWENVVFDIAGHIISKLRPRTKPIT